MPLGPGCKRHNGGVRIGEYQDLEVVRGSPQGFYLSDGEMEVLLPRKQCPLELQVGDELRVFVLTDSEDRPIATTLRPKATVGKFALMRVVSVSNAGAFLDWGLDKDLFCPFREQRRPMSEGEEYVVRVYLDQVTERVVASSKLNRFLNPEGEGLQIGQQVKIMVTEFTPEAAIVIIDDTWKGSLFRDEMHERLRIGDTRDAFIKNIRPQDKKVAVSLRPIGYEAVLGEKERILKSLELNGGMLNVSDKSSPEEIQKRFGLSKGAFKKVLGALYKEGKIEIEPYAIRLKK